MRPEAFLFDLDGTLCDGAAAIHDSFEHALREHGLPPVDPSRVAAMIGVPLRLMFRELCGADEQTSASLVRSYRERFDRRAPDLVRSTPGMREALDHFSNVPMALVTTKAVEPARVVLKALGIEERFPVVVGVDTVRRPKPDPEGARVALARLGVGAFHTVFVGDTVMDVFAGKGAQTRTVAVLCGHGDPGELQAAAPDAIIQDLRGLPDAIRGL